MDSKNFILFGGIPRSGTTLTCHIFNQCPNSHALIESMDMNLFLKSCDSAARAKFINDYLTTIYSRIQSNLPIDINYIESQDTNTFAEEEVASGVRRKSKIVEKRPTVIHQPLYDGFKLILKHPNAFIALLPELTRSFCVFAQIRQPLAILASWNSIDHPLTKGHAPIAERFDGDLKSRLADIEDDLDRQIALLDWYYSVIYHNLESDRIIRYEDIINTKGEALSKIIEQDYLGKMELKSRNNNSAYDNNYLNTAYDRLVRNADHACWNFYTVSELR